MKTLLSVGPCLLVYFALLVSVCLGQPGSLDGTFNPGSGANNIINCIALQTNGQIVIGGNFTVFNGSNRKYVARLNSDGSLDSSFDPGAGVGGQVYSLTVQANGEILIGGVFETVSSPAYNDAAQLRADGSIDVSFALTNDNASSIGITALAVQNEGQILLGGDFSSINGVTCNDLVRLNSNGTLDTTFSPGTNFLGGRNIPNAIGLQSNGQIIVGGAFSVEYGAPFNFLARLNTDGSLDTNFNARVSGGQVSCLEVTTQDQIVIGGSFSSINGYSRNGIARLNPDGSVDTTFDPGLGVGGYVNGLAIQSNGMVIVVGSFGSVNGTNRDNVARFNTNGSLDLSFNAGHISIGIDAIISSLALQPDGKTLIVGGFSAVGNTNINCIARLNGDFSPTNTLQFLSTSIYFGAYLEGTISNTYRIEWTSDFNTPSLWTPLFSLMLQTNPQFVLDPNPATAQRFYRAVQVNP